MPNSGNLLRRCCCDPLRPPSISNERISHSGAAGRRAQAQWRREWLLDAVLAVFVDKGVDGAAVTDITAAAGVTQGLLYHYFDGKDAPVVALLGERGFLPELRRLLAGSPRRRGPAGAGGGVPAGRANPAIRAGLQGFVAEGQQLLGLTSPAGSTGWRMTGRAGIDAGWRPDVGGQPRVSRWRRARTMAASKPTSPTST